MRFASVPVQKLAKFWPITGIVGLRQVGKTTLIQNLMSGNEAVSLDDHEALEEAQSTPKVFLSKRQEPLLIDEIQKAPKLFDALKFTVDRNRKPGRFFITGSTSFSAKLGIRESLTGRIGILHLHPLTLAETEQRIFAPQMIAPIHSHAPRFEIEDFSKSMCQGGLPVPFFTRDSEQRQMYWKSWLDVSLYRDLKKLVGRNYEPDLAFNLLNRTAVILSEGSMPTLKHFSLGSTKLRVYLQAFEDAFILRKFLCREEGTGKEIWNFTDSGLLNYLLPQKSGEAVNQALARAYWFNEISAGHEYQGKSFHPTYFKSSRGSVVDLIWDQVSLKVIAKNSNLGWEERSLHAVMKKLKLKRGVLVAPVSKPEIAKTGISILPWSYWS